MNKSNQFWDLFSNFENETTFGIKLVTENQMSMRFSILLGFVSV
jgi:hypothetical protein